MNSKPIKQKTKVYKIDLHKTKILSTLYLNDDAVISNTFTKRRLDKRASKLTLNSTPIRARLEPSICIIMHKLKSITNDDVSDDDDGSHSRDNCEQMCTVINNNQVVKAFT